MGTPPSSVRPKGSLLTHKAAPLSLLGPVRNLGARPACPHTSAEKTVFSGQAPGGAIQGCPVGLAVLDLNRCLGPSGFGKEVKSGCLLFLKWKYSTSVLSPKPVLWCPDGLRTKGRVGGLRGFAR